MDPARRQVPYNPDTAYNGGGGSPMYATRGEMALLHDAIRESKKDLHDQVADTRNEVDELRVEMRSEHTALRADIKSEMTTIRLEISKLNLWSKAFTAGGSLTGIAVGALISYLLAHYKP